MGTSENISNQSKSNRPRSAHIPRTNTQNNIKNEFAKCSSIDKILSSTSKKAIVGHGLVKERAKLFEKKIEENKKMVEDRRRPRYFAPTMASKARQKPPLRELPNSRFSHAVLKPSSTREKLGKYEERDEVLVMKIPPSFSGQSGQGWSWSSASPRSTEAEMTLMQTSSSSNESRSSARKVVASYSSCALAQRPVFTSSAFPARTESKSKKAASQTQMPSSKNMVTSIISSGKSSISPLSETENKVDDYFDDEIDDQPDLTLNENEQSYCGTPATEFPPTSFSAILNNSNHPGKTVKNDGGESDARDLASELFMAGKTPEDETAIKDSSLNASLESLENDQQIQQQQHDRSKLQLDLVNANLEINSTTAPMRNRDNKKKEETKLGNSGLVSMMCSNCGGTNSNKDANNLVLIQDVISIKSYLQKLRRILHDSDESSNIITDDPIKCPSSTIFAKISRENGRNKSTEDEINDLKKQVALLTQQNVEKDRKIESLHCQLDEFKFPAKITLAQKNGATQTERVKVFSVSSDSSSSNRSHSSSPAGAQEEA